LVTLFEIATVCIKRVCNEMGLRDPIKKCIIEENSGDRHLDGNVVPEVAYNTGHIIWTACQSQRTATLNRRCRRSENGDACACRIICCPSMPTAHATMQALVLTYPLPQLHHLLVKNLSGQHQQLYPSLASCFAFNLVCQNGSQIR